MKPEDVRNFEVIIIGGGPGGYSAAIRLAQAGVRVACIERESVGGVCLNWGCIPSKALISVAQRYHLAQSSSALGVSAQGVTLDMVQAQRHNRGVVKHHTHGVADLLRTNGATLIAGEARLLSSRDVQVTPADGAPFVVKASRGIVIATGVKPRVLSGFTADGLRILTAKEAVFLEQVPEHLVVLGGGVIGLELGGAYQQLGARLTIVEMAEQLLPGTDPDLVAVVNKRLAHQGASVLLKARALGWQERSSGVHLKVQTPDGEVALDASHVLVAAGFVPFTEGLDLESAGVALDERGHIRTQEDCQTTAPGVYAIGDVAGPPYLAHKAFAEAQVIFDVFTGHRAKRDWRALPSAIFTEPEIATVGLSESAARAQSAAVSVGRFPFSALGRAMARGQTEGFVKLVAIDGYLVGAGIVGADASELIAELTLAIEVGATLEDLSLTIHPHPTLSEAVHDAADHGLGHAVHVLNRGKRNPQPRTGAA